MAYGESYDQFVEKFKPKLTTDDCYTPPLVYEAVLNRVYELYPATRSMTLIRPFKPGGDYQAEDYSDKVVIDNPPFSILAEIINFYTARNIKFYLFAPALTGLAYVRYPGVCIVNIKRPIVYHNGANVRTAFLTNLDSEFIVRQDDVLDQRIKDALKGSKTQTKRSTIIRDPNCYTNTDLIRESLSIPRSAFVAFHRKNSENKQYFGGAIEIDLHKTIDPPGTGE